jgi:hypothetical protein
MSVNEPTVTPPPLAPAKPRPARRPASKAVLMWVRRGHLYFGLFLFPWAVLYGVTAFLFNHPTAFSDQPAMSFGPAATTGTPLECPTDPQAIAEQVVAKLNAVQKPETPYSLAGPAKFGGREFAVASVKADGQTVSVFLNLKAGGGTVRSTPTRERKEPEKAPFAVGSSGPRVGRGGPPGGGRGGPPRADGGRGGDSIRLDDPLADRVKASVPAVLERTGFPAGEVSVTSVPDVVFPMEADGRIWTATYSPLSGAVSGSPADAKPEAELGWRRFLLRLHTAHGYPGETNSRWFWALIVDAMAFTMCFWGLSGLVMWWQIKATRRAGFVVLLLSTAAATALGFAMHAALTS